MELRFTILKVFSKKPCRCGRKLNKHHYSQYKALFTVKFIQLLHLLERGWRSDNSKVLTRSSRFEKLRSNVEPWYQISRSSREYQDQRGIE